MAGRKSYLYSDATMSEIAHCCVHVSDERSGADRKGTVAVPTPCTMLQGCGAGVLDVRNVDLSLVMALLVSRNNV
jgi:hypothetical protein